MTVGELIKLMKEQEKKLGTMIRLDLYSDGTGRIDKNDHGFLEKYIEFESINELMSKLRELHQETINKLRQELKGLNNIESIKRQLEEHCEEKVRQLTDDEIKCSEGNTDTLEEAIARFKDEQK